MCGRYALACTYDALKTHFGVVDHICFKPRYNVAPGQTVLAILPGRKIQFMRWGFRPSWAKPESPEYINARLETLLEKTAFKQSFLKRRCLIPATGYFEWKQLGAHKQPSYQILKEHPIIAFAGIWSLGFDPDLNCLRETVAIVTHREKEPVVLTELEYHAWLSGEDLEALQVTLEKQAWPWKSYEVTRKMNHPSFDTPECLALYLP